MRARDRGGGGGAFFFSFFPSNELMEHRRDQQLVTGSASWDDFLLSSDCAKCSAKASVLNEK